MSTAPGGFHTEGCVQEQWVITSPPTASREQLVTLVAKGVLGRKERIAVRTKP